MLTSPQSGEAEWKREDRQTEAGPLGAVLGWEWAEPHLASGRVWLGTYDALGDMSQRQLGRRPAHKVSGPEGGDLAGDGGDGTDLGDQWRLLSGGDSLFSKCKSHLSSLSHSQDSALSPQGLGVHSLRPRKGWKAGGTH